MKTGVWICIRLISSVFFHESWTAPEMIRILRLFMRNSFFGILSIALAVAFLFPDFTSPVSIHFVRAEASPPTSVSTTPNDVGDVDRKDVQNPAEPVRLIIPSINIDSPVVGVGINEKGEMDVPDGSTDRVGWYKYG